jgi:hypothetical protein
MLDAPTRMVLQETLRRESRSLLQYIAEAFPWTKAENAVAVSNLKLLASEQLAASTGLMRFLQQQHAAPPFLGSFPSSFTSMNFVTLEYLGPQLVKHTQKETADLERDLRMVSDSAARTLLTELLSLKRNHLAGLEKLS